MLRVGVVGATGYTGLELIRLLSAHPKVVLTYVTSRSHAGKTLAEAYPAFLGVVDLVLKEYDPLQAVKAADFFFLALPHGLSAPVARDLLKAGKKVVDLGSDFRLDDPSAYKEWYGREAADRTGLRPVYGLPELHRAAVRRARLVANPGCYASSVILALAPLLRARRVDPRSIVVDAKSGVSGAGRSLSLATHFVEVHENFRAYKVGRHQHTPEIEQELSRLGAGEVRLRLTTHLLPVNRGILSSCTARLKGKADSKALLRLYRDFYRREPFVTVLPEGVYPSLREVYGSNDCRIGLHADDRTGTVLVLSALDNLTKGAAGCAVQNMNLMEGFPEGLALSKLGLVP